MAEPPPPMVVSGGTGGVRARFDDLHTLAALSDDAATTYATVAVQSHAVLVDPNLLASAVLDPAGAARFERTLLEALDGDRGVSRLAVELGAQSIGLRATVATYETAEAAQKALIDDLRWAAGAAALPVAALFVLNPVDWPLLAAAGYAGSKVDWAAFITDHPGLVDDVVGATPGLVTGLMTSLGIPGVVPDVPSGAGLVGLLYPDGHVTATPASDPSAAVWAGRNLDQPPQHLSDVVAGLDQRNSSVGSGPTDPDQIDVRVVQHPDGTKSYIVDIPGTKVWDTPGQDTGTHSNTLGSNLHAMAGQSTAREQAVAQALRLAGASPTDPVMLVGHSQGGMVAAQAAVDAHSGSFGFNVTHVVTAGSPIGRIDIPPDVHVLSLENSHDIVPHLDAAANPDRPNWTTVTFDHRFGNFDSHSTDLSYLPAAQALDSSTDPSVTAFNASATGFYGAPQPGTTASHQVFTLSRDPSPGGG